MTGEEKRPRGTSSDEEGRVLSEIEGELRAIFSRVRKSPDNNPGPDDGGEDKHPP